jgi:hypothetical protein
MKKIPKIKTGTFKKSDEMEKEYHLDYSKAKPNRFSPRLMPIDEDIAKIFTTPESVNNALRSIIAAFPESIKKYSSVDN